MKKRILISETGGTLTRNVIASLRKSKENYYIIGITSHPYEIALSNADVSYLVPEAKNPAFIPIVNVIAQKTGAQFLHSQHDAVIKVLANNRRRLVVPTFFPASETVNRCVDKFESFKAWKQSGVPAARSMEISSPGDLKKAFSTYGKTVWIRLKEGGGGAGSLPVSDYSFAKIWIDHFHGWPARNASASVAGGGKFIASELLSPDSVTWSSIWKDGQLIVAQSRKRLYWLFGNRTLSGVTGVTGAAVTVRDEALDRLAKRAILAIDPLPNGIFSVDMTYDLKGKLRATEINIGRFFTTIHFFTEAGLNMPDIFVRLAFGEKLPKITRKINPLPPGLVWVRGMDTPPVLTKTSVIAKYQKDLERMKKAI